MCPGETPSLTVLIYSSCSIVCFCTYYSKYALSNVSFLGLSLNQCLKLIYFMVFHLVKNLEVQCIMSLYVLTHGRPNDPLNQRVRRDGRTVNKFIKHYFNCPLNHHHRCRHTYNTTEIKRYCVCRL